MKKFDGNITFSIWLVQVRDVLIQIEFDKSLKGTDSMKGYEKDFNKSNMSDKDWEWMLEL